jgi:membrane-bound ClpP family serine protease
MFDVADQTDSIILAGVVLVVYEAIMIMTFYFLAPVIVLILYSIFTGSSTLVSNINVYASEYYFIVKVLFAIGFLVPLVWFITWVFRIERGNYGNVIMR